MKVKILLNLPATIDGEKIGPFIVGAEVELPDSTARKFIASQMAEEVLPPAEVVDVSPVITGDGTGDSLAPIEEEPQPRTGRARRAD